MARRQVVVTVLLAGIAGWITVAGPRAAHAIDAADVATLRAAIAASNANSTDDVIVLTGGSTYSMAGAGLCGKLSVAGPGTTTTITTNGGGRATLDGTGCGDVVFDLAAGAVVVLEHLVVTGGGPNSGGPGGGIRSAATLTIRDSIITGNHATSGSSGADAGPDDPLVALSLIHI